MTTIAGMIPLFIFDDTMFHRLTNKVDHIKEYCLFMDIVVRTMPKASSRIAVV